MDAKAELTKRPLPCMSASRELEGAVERSLLVPRAADHRVTGYIRARLRFR